MTGAVSQQEGNPSCNVNHELFGGFPQLWNVAGLSLAFWQLSRSISTCCFSVPSFLIKGKHELAQDQDPLPGEYCFSGV